MNDSQEEVKSVDWYYEGNSRGRGISVWGFYTETDQSAMPPDRDEVRRKAVEMLGQDVVSVDKYEGSTSFWVTINAGLPKKDRWAFFDWVADNSTLQAKAA